MFVFLFVVLPLLALMFVAKLLQSPIVVFALLLGLIMLGVK
jgi:hypothetical protein